MSIGLGFRGSGAGTIRAPGRRGAATGWHILVATEGSGPDNPGSWNASATAFGKPGTTDWPSSTPEGTGAASRVAIGDGWGLYKGFFLAKHLTRLDQYQAGATPFHGNDTVWGEPSVLNHTAGPNGYSGLLEESGGIAFKTTGAGTPTPDKMCVLGINRASDNDIQALCFYSGHLGDNSVKSDSWRNTSPAETFWSYWGGDFHSGSASQRIGANYIQTGSGVNRSASYSGNVYVLGYGKM